MSGFIQGQARSQSTLFLEALDDYITEDNPLPVVFKNVSAEICLHVLAYNLKRIYLELSRNDYRR